MHYLKKILFDGRLMEYIELKRLLFFKLIS